MRRILVLVAVLPLAAGCLPSRAPRWLGGGPAEAVVRGAALYGGFCADCHGFDGAGHGPAARFLDLDPPDLRATALLVGASDAEVVRRLRSGDPLPVSRHASPLRDDRRVDEILAYLAGIERANWTLLLAGRLVYEAECAPCHGVYGNNEFADPGLVSGRLEDLRVSRERHTDEELARISLEGTGAMPPLVGGFDPVELRALVAYVRHLSPGYRLYDTYCVLCHGHDGRGAEGRELLAPRVAAPPLTASRLARRSDEERRASVRHMLAREESRMPHLRGILSDAQLRDVVAFLRGWAR